MPDIERLAFDRVRVNENVFTIDVLISGSIDAGYCGGRRFLLNLTISHLEIAPARWWKRGVQP